MNSTVLKISKEKINSLFKVIVFFYKLLVNRYIRNGQLEEAIATLEIVTKDYPVFWSGHNNLAIANFQSGNVDKALKLTEMILEKNPGFLVSFLIVWLTISLIIFLSALELILEVAVLANSTPAFLMALVFSAAVALAPKAETAFFILSVNPGLNFA